MLTKKDIANRLSERTHLNKAQSLEVIERLIDILEDAVINNGGVQIVGFATLTTKTVKSRTIVNPVTKKPMQTKDSKSLYIKTGSNFKSKLNK